MADLEAEETLEERAALEADHAVFAGSLEADAEEGDVEGRDHNDDAGGDELLNLGVDVFGEVGVDDDTDQNQRAELPVEAEDQIHASAGAGNIAHSEEQAGQEERDADRVRAALAVVLADGVNGGHAGGDGEPVGGHDEGDAHEDDGEHEPDQVIAVVGTQHCGCGDSTGTDDDAGSNEAGADTLEELTQRKGLDVLTDQAGGFLFFHTNLLFSVFVTDDK